LICSASDWHGKTALYRSRPSEKILVTNPPPSAIEKVAGELERVA
jgi:hypothetical protein